MVDPRHPLIYPISVPHPTLVPELPKAGKRPEPLTSGATVTPVGTN